MVDNTKLIREKLLDFKDPGDFYVCHVIQRAKDKRADGTLNPGDTRDEGQRLIMATQPGLIGKDYVIPDGVVTICDGAFAMCNGYTVLSAPRSIRAIGDYIFGDEGGKIVIRD